jgi:hypothetical protein
MNLETIEQYLNDNCREWDNDRNTVFILAIENFLWQMTKTLMANFLILPPHVKGEIMIRLAHYPEHLYALSNDTQLTHPCFNGIWCEIYKRRFGGLPSFPRFTQMSMMSIYMAKELDPIYKQKRINVLSKELSKVGCELRADSSLCEQWINNSFNKHEGYFTLENVVDTMFKVNLLFTKYNMAEKLSKYFKANFIWPKKPSPADKKNVFSTVKCQLLEKIPQCEIDLAKKEARQKYAVKEKGILIYSSAARHVSILQSYEFAQSAHYIITIRRLLNQICWIENDMNSDEWDDLDEY